MFELLSKHPHQDSWFCWLQQLDAEHDINRLVEFYIPRQTQVLLFPILSHLLTLQGSLKSPEIVFFVKYTINWICLAENILQNLEGVAIFLCNCTSDCGMHECKLWRSISAGIWEFGEQFSKCVNVMGVSHPKKQSQTSYLKWTQISASLFKERFLKAMIMSIL